MRIVLLVLSIAFALFVSACGGRGAPSRADRPAAPGAAVEAANASLAHRQAPLANTAAPIAASQSLPVAADVGERSPQLPNVEADQGNTLSVGRALPGARGAAIAGGGTAAKLPERKIPEAAVNLPQIDNAPASSYAAESVLTNFAQSYLGITPAIRFAAATDANVTLPADAAVAMNASITLAGQVNAGVITLNGAPGAAQVAVGSGSISGDLQADLSGASLGAFSLALNAVSSPVDEAAAFSLLLSTYPGLADAGLQSQASDQGFLFKAVTTHEGVDWQSRQVTLVAEVVMAGVTTNGPSPVVWAVVANGTFATALQ